jgi:hypothetical protein
MVSQQERERLIEAYSEEPLYVTGVVTKCSACMLVLVGIGLIGATVGPEGSTLQVQTATYLAAKSARHLEH